MKEKQRANLEVMEGRTFILGREGHIYIDSPTASKHHAEITIVDGRIHLRDLNSTNGTFLLKNKTLIRFHEGYVNRRQPIVIGKHAYVIEDLLVIARDFVTVHEDDTRTHVDLTGSWKKRVTHKLQPPSRED
jgi:hypothetical protein